jgi:hypothetical protein
MHISDKVKLRRAQKIISDVHERVKIGIRNNILRMFGTERIGVRYNIVYFLLFPSSLLQKIIRQQNITQVRE